LRSFAAEDFQTVENDRETGSVPSRARVEVFMADILSHEMRYSPSSFSPGM
jgi:hypothetical protein